MIPIEEKRVAYRHPQLRELQTKRESGFFLHPQVQLVWVEMAAQLGTQALVVGILLQFRFLLSQKESVTLPKNFLVKFGISKGVKQRALKSLEEAGLVSIVQEIGRSPLITLHKV
ncbi:MAG: hypothetical protein CMA81_08270 [Euryarchaeota archaeon]|nr:hypothetical protein [Euryarchaeota archaeon]MEC7222186.1 hypothetical protein [SAR324 cluster bacterium]|tara:strand:- start:207 stop:551 length:345 start_codon:yes stop_codon:yes gene_type:complete